MPQPPSTLKQTTRRRAGDAAAPTPGLVLIYSAGQPTFVVVPFNSRELLIGRSEMAALAEDQRVSRRHARVSYDGERFWVEDLNSQNRSVVDGVPVPLGLPKEARQILRVGDSIFLLSYDIQSFQGSGLKIQDEKVLGPSLQLLCRYAASASQAGGALYITGESGAGKELLARAFHAGRGHGGGPFVAINCSAIPDGMAERLLFGTKRGAFSGADADADGYLQAAHGGTLFLDEVADLSLLVQAKLLRVLETREVLPLGASRPRSIDVRICAASNKPLRAEVGAGRFREDLYFRIGQPEVQLPPLRQRCEEIPWLIALEMKRAPANLKIHTSLVEACLLRPWPGNVRELLAAVRTAAHAAVLAGDSKVDDRHLGVTAGTALPTPERLAESSSPDSVAALPHEEARRAELETALRHADGNVSRAARSLGVHRNQLCRWLTRYQIDAKTFRST